MIFRYLAIFNSFNNFLACATFAVISSILPCIVPRYKISVNIVQDTREATEPILRSSSRDGTNKGTVDFLVK